MRKIIINADDLGISLEVNSQIEEGIKRGVITSSTLMANAPAFDDGVRIAKQYPQISVGVHLNLIEFKPLTNADVFRKHGILDSGGSFIEGAIFSIPIDAELQNAVFEEWDAQISKVEAAGVEPTHCDSHQHTHAIRALQEPLIRVLKKHHIPKVRRKMIPSIKLMLSERKHPIVHLDKSNAMQPKRRNVFYRRIHLFNVICDNKKWNKEMGNHFRMTDCFYPFRNFCNDFNAINVKGENIVIELMCHPGHPAFNLETTALMQDKKWLPNGFVLVSYKEI